MAATSTVRLLFLGDASSAVRSTRQLSGAMGGLGKAASTVGKVLAVGLVGGLAASVKAAVDFDKAMRNVNSIARLNEKQFKQLSKQVLAMAKETGQAPKTLAEGMYDIVSSGFKANDAIKILQSSAKAATAGLTDTATATKAVVAVLNAYHMDAGKAAEVSDILFQTVNKGVLTFEELASQIGDVLPVAAQLGVPLEDIGGAMATITLHGVNAAEAATQLKQLLVSMLKPSEDLTKTFKEWGFASGETALKTLGLEGVMKRLTQEAHGSGEAFANWFSNVRAMNGALGISGKNIKTLHENIKAMTQSQGAATRAFDEQSKSISVQWQKVKAQLTAAAIPIGQLLFPALEKAIGGVQKLAEAMEGHLPEIKATFTGIGTAVVDTVHGLDNLRQQAGLSGQQMVALGVGSLAGAKAFSVMSSGLKVATGLFAGINPLMAAGAVIVGGLASRFLEAKLKGDIWQQSLRPVADSLRNLATANDNVSTTWRTQVQLQQQIRTLGLQIEGMEVLRARSIKETGAASLETRQIENSLKIARTTLGQATRDLAKVEQLHKDSIKGRTAAEQNAINTIEGHRKAMQKLIDTSGGAILGDKKGIQSINAHADAVEAYFRIVGASPQKTAAARASVKAFYDAIGKPPNLTQIKRMLGELFSTEEIVNKARRAGSSAGRVFGESGREGARQALTIDDAVRKVMGQLQRVDEKKIKEKKLTVDTSSVQAAINKVAQLAAMKLPTITQTIRQVVTRTTTTSSRTTSTRRAGGGVIPGTGPGDTVPAMLTPGELVLNRSQQHRLAKVLGIPDKPEAIFEAVQRFAGGGVVQYFASGGVAKRPPRARKPPAGNIGSSGRDFPRPFRESGANPAPAKQAVAEIMAPVASIRQLIQDKNRQYAQKSRAFDQSEEVFIIEKEDPATGEFYEELDEQAVAKRLAELDELIRLREELVQLLVEYGDKLHKAQIELNALIERMKNEIAALRARIARARASLHDLNATLRAVRATPRRESTAQQERDLQNLINYYEGDIRQSEKEIDEDESVIKDARSNRNTIQGYRHDLPMDKEDARLDLIDIQKERNALAELKAAAREPGVGVDDGGGGDGGGGGGDVGAAPGEGDRSAEEQRLREIIGRLALALGIQTAQLGVVDVFKGKVATGQFAAGGMVKLPVGMPTLAVVHGGEMILNPRQQRRLGGTRMVAEVAGLPGFAEGGYLGPTMPGGWTGRGGNRPALQVRVSHTYAPGMEWLRQFVDTRVAAQQFAISRGADILRREGRF